MAVRIIEVGPRDGLQNVSATVPTAIKLELIARLQQSGLQNIEITSVVSPKAVPQLADCQQILSSDLVQKELRTPSKVRLPVLIPNTKGLEIALRHGVKEVAVFVSATEGFSKANINCTVEEGIQRARQVATAALEKGLLVRGYVSCIFSDPYDGPTSPPSVLRVTKDLLDAGCYEVSIGDTLGVGTVSEVRGLIEYLKQNGVDLSRIACHFHDTYGQALANVWEAYRCGISAFDSSVGGLGGCPFAPGAKGNLATEDVTYMFEKSGIQTGLDLAKLVDTGAWISRKLRKPNSSRAGSALALKQLATKEPGPDQKATPLVWKQVRETDNVLLLCCGANGKIVLNKPRNGNALTLPMIADIRQGFEYFTNESSISRIVIAAKGKFFCTGMNLSKTESAVGNGGDASRATFEGLTQLFQVIDNSDKVTIACINGPAFGGGIGLAFVCDIRLCVSSSSFTLSEVKLGLCPAVISQYVIREWGVPLSREAMLMARPVSAQELRSAGAISGVCENADKLESALESLLATLRHSSPGGSRMSKELIRLAWAYAGRTEQKETISRLFQEMMGPNSDSAFGVKEFQAKRKADWDLHVRRKSEAKL